MTFGAAAHPDDQPAVCRGVVRNAHIIDSRLDILPGLVGVRIKIYSRFAAREHQIATAYRQSTVTAHAGNPLRVIRVYTLRDGVIPACPVLRIPGPRIQSG